MDGGKITNREHYRRIGQQTGQKPESLYKMPEIEPELLYLFRYFVNLKGREPLRFTEMEAWQRLTGIELTPGEVEMIFVIDSAFYTAQQPAE